jgi:hypothetical protein
MDFVALCFSGLPVVMVSAWVLVRASFENDFCWTTQNSHALLVIKIPIIISILVSCFQIGFRWMRNW